MDIGKKISEFKSVMESSFNSAREVAKDLSKSVKNMFHERSSHVKDELKKDLGSTDTSIKENMQKEQKEPDINKFLQEARLVNQNKYMSQPDETKVTNKIQPKQNQTIEKSKPNISPQIPKNFEQSLNQEFKTINSMGKAAAFENFCKATQSNAFDVLSFPTSFSLEEKLAALDTANVFLNPNKAIQAEFKTIQNSGKTEDFRQFCGDDHQKIQDAVFFPDHVEPDDKIRALTLMKQFNEKLEA